MHLKYENIRKHNRITDSPDGTSKFIVHPNYKMKVSRELVANVNFITATRVKDPAEFTLPKYRKI